MTSMELLELLGSVRDSYVVEAHRETEVKRISFRKPLLAAALIAVSLLLVGCSVAYAQGWFDHYFENNTGEPLSQGQQDYLAENEQIIAESETKDQWTVELRSAITDGTTGYIIIGVIAPEGVDLEPEVVDGSLTESFGPGNHGMARLYMDKDTPEFLTTSDGKFVGYGSSWKEDGDGKDNTKNMVLELTPAQWLDSPDPFNLEYHIHIENIVRQYEDQEYLQELLSTKYAGQTDYMLDSDETMRLHQTEVLAEGVWDFTVKFDQKNDCVELLSEPIKVMGYAYREGPPLNEFLNDTIESYEEIEITSIELRPLTVTVTYVSDVCCQLSNADSGETYVVMKDGSKVEMRERGGRGSLDLVSMLLEAKAPIVLSEVDHILFPDGTKIPMPDQP